MEIDLDENNYDYEKLIKLFSLTPTFNKHDLKKAKLKVLKLHPDKSGFNPKIYIFMSKMYYKLEEVYNYTHHETDPHKLNVSYDTHDHFKKYLIENNIDPINNYQKFSEEFNKMFESVYVAEDNDGYGDWLKSNEDMYDKDNLEKSRKDALSKKGAIIIQEKIEEYDINRSNRHSDIKDCYVNPFVAMDLDKVYQEKPKFKNVQEYQIHMAEDDKNNVPLSDEASMRYIQNKESLLNNNVKEFAFQKVKHKEKMDKNYEQYISSYLRLKE